MDTLDQHKLPGTRALDSLTRREIEILTLIGSGVSLAEIARRLHRSLQTVKSHRASISRKLGVSDRVGLARVAIQSGLALLSDGAPLTGRAEQDAECARISWDAYKSVDAALFICSLDTTIRHANKAAENLLRRPAEELVGKRLADVLTPSLASLSDAVLRVASEELARLRFKVGGHAPEEMTLLADMLLLTGTTGMAPVVWVALRDITDVAHQIAQLEEARTELEARAEQHARELEASVELLRREAAQRQRLDARLRDIVEGIGASSGTGFFRLLVRNLCRTLEVDHALVIERTWTEAGGARMTIVAGWSHGSPLVLPVQSLDRGPCEMTIGAEACHIPTGLRSLFPQSVLLQHLPADSYLGLPLSASGGEALGVLCVLCDRSMTEQSEHLPILKVFGARAAAELERSRTDSKFRATQQRLGQLTELLPVGVYQQDPSGRYVYVNERLCAVLKQSADFITARGWFDAVATQDRNRVLEFRERASSHGEAPASIRYRVRIADVERWLEETRRPFLNADGAVDGWLGTIADVTIAETASVELRRSEERHKTAVELAKLGTWEFDVRTEVREWSARTKLMFGLSPHDPAPTPEQYMQLVHPDDREMVTKSAHVAILGGQTLRREYRVIRSDGTLAYLQSHGVVYRDEQGQATRIVGTVMDVTESRAALDRVRASEERLQTAIDLADMVTWEYDPARDQTRWSPRMNAILGLSAEAPALSLKQFLQITHPDDRASLEAAINDALIGTRPFSIELRASRSDGDERILQSRGVVTRDSLGNAVRMNGTCIDVTEARRTLDAVRASENRYRAIVEGQVEYVTRYLPDTTLTFVNQTIMKAFGPQIGNPLGTRWIEWYAPEDRDATMATIRSLSPENPIVTNTQCLPLDGRRVWVEWSNHGIFDDNGRCIEIQGLGRDITDWYFAEQALRYCRRGTASTDPSCRVGIFETDQQLNRRYLNSELCRILRCTHDDLVGDGWMRIIHPADLPQLRERWRRAVETLTPVESHHRVVRGDGKVLHVEVFAAPRLDQNGVLAGFLGTVVEVAAPSGAT
ncbi:MAG: PAS domain-containing protein [Phycisphaerales bacterium]|nr:PAS domain-containing protein [Phycisphaerales bacterium]